MTVTRRIRSPGRARNKPLKPLRAGMPGDPGEPSVTTLVCSLHHSHTRLRVHWAPGIPHALMGRKVYQYLGRVARRELYACAEGSRACAETVIASAAKQSTLSFCCTMDCFASLAIDD